MLANHWSRVHAQGQARYRHCRLVAVDRGLVDGPKVLLLKWMGEITRHLVVEVCRLGGDLLVGQSTIKRYRRLIC